MNKEMGDLKKRLSAAEMSGSWCASKDRWTTSKAVVTFNSIFHEDSSMNGNPLNKKTGKNE